VLASVCGFPWFVECSLYNPDGIRCVFSYVHRVSGHYITDHSLFPVLRVVHVSDVVQLLPVTFFFVSNVGNTACVGIMGCVTALEAGVGGGFNSWWGFGRMSRILLGNMV
jgi:hypothetical protein